MSPAVKYLEKYCKLRGRVGQGDASAALPVEHGDRSDERTDWPPEFDNEAWNKAASILSEDSPQRLPAIEMAHAAHRCTRVKRLHLATSSASDPATAAGLSSLRAKYRTVGDQTYQSDASPALPSTVVLHLPNGRIGLHQGSIMTPGISQSP
jgi:hypothetical protein